MSYDIHITLSAERDLNRAADYITYELKNPQAADHLLDQAEEKILSLTEMPQKHAPVDDPLLSSWGIRFVQVGHYLAFYVIAEEQNQVTIVRFLYEKSNWISILRSGLPLI